MSLLRTSLLKKLASIQKLPKAHYPDLCTNVVDLFGDTINIDILDEIETFITITKDQAEGYNLDILIAVYNG